MNISDEEIKEVTDQNREDIENLLEPQMIPDERIIRHADTNDHYREPTESDESEIIAQPSLEVVPENEKELENGISYKEPPEVVPTPDVLIGDDSNEIQLKSPIIESAVPSTGTVYHTISGGPDTLSDTMAHEQVLQPQSSSKNNKNNTEYVSSGYSIPNPEYLGNQPNQPNQVTHVEEQHNIWVIFSLFVTVIVGGLITYSFFFVPEILDQMFQGMDSIKNQLFKK